MNGLIAETLAWWRGGDLLMPAMLAVALVLYAILAERTIVLWGLRRRQRHDEILAALRTGADIRWRAWAASYVALDESGELARGFAICRVLTTSLPLLGLLGTVTGMVGTFGSLGAAGGGGAQVQQAGAGIGLALTATQYGMALAIPAVLWERLLAARAARLAAQREEACCQAMETPCAS